MSEAPKTIFLINPELDQCGWDSQYVNSQDRPIPGLLSVEYIRKDVYDELQARIKELEEGLIKIKCLPEHSDSILSSFQIADELLAKGSE